MGRLHCLTLGLFLFAVRAEKEDFQGYLKEETKGTTVTKDWLLENENTIGHGKEAIPTENTHRHTVMAVTAKFPGAILFDTRPTQPYERIQITGAQAIIALPSSKEQFVSKNEQISTQDDPSTVRIKSEIPLISNYERIVFSSTRPALESMMNGSSEPEVHLSADAVKAPPWVHALPDVRNQRNTDSVTLTSADGGLGGPILSASHPRVIDNLAEQHHDNDDKRSPGKVFSNVERNVYALSTKQSILQSNAADDSLRGNTVTKLCLTCLKGVTPHGSTGSLSEKGLTSDFNQLTSFLSSSVSAGEQQINHQNITNHYKFTEKGRLVYNQTFLPYNKTSIRNHSQIRPLFSETEMVALETQSLAEMPTVTKKGVANLSRNTNLSETFVRQRPTTALHLSKLFYTKRKPAKNGEQEMSGKKVSIGDSQSKLVHFTESNGNASQNPTTNLKNVFIQRQPLDNSSGSVNNMPVITETPYSSQRSVLPGTDHSAASLLAATMSLIQAHTAITPFSISRPHTSAVKNPESHFLTGRGDSLISVLRSQTPAKPSSQNKATASTLLPKDSAVQFESVTTKTHLTDEQDSPTFNTVHSIVTQSFVDPSGPVTKPVIKEPQSETFTTTKVVPENLFPSESSQVFGSDVSVLTLTTLSSKSFSDKSTTSRRLAAQSKQFPEGSFGVSNDKNVASTQQSSAKYNGILIRESLIVHSLKLGDKNEQVLTEAAENEEKGIVKMEGKRGEEIQETKEKLKSHEEGESRLENKLEELFRLDRTESEKQGKMNTVAEINQNTHKEAEEMEELRPKTSTEKSGRTTGEEDLTLRQDKEEISDEGEAERQDMTEINKENCTKCVATKQKESLTKEGPEAGRVETSTKEDFRRKGKIGKGGMTNVPLRPTANSEDLNRDKGHTVTKLSSCRTLIKQSSATKNKDIHRTENTMQPEEITNKSFSYKRTSNHRPPQSTLRSQTSEVSNALFFSKPPCTQIKDHQSTHTAMFPEHRATALFTTESTHNKVVEAALSVTAIPRSPHTHGVTTSKHRDKLRPTVSTSSGAAQSTALNSMLSLTTLRLAVTAGILRAQPHFTVNSSTLKVSIIYSILDHRHKFSTSPSILHPANEREQAEYITPSVNPALHQQMYNDSSTRPPTATALSSQAYISTGQLQPHQGQPAPQISQSSSSSSSDMTSGQPCSFKLSEQTAHPDALHAAVDDNEQRSAQTLMASMSPKAKNDQFPLSSMSTLLNLRLFGGDSLPGTYRTTGVSRSVTVKNTLRDASTAEYANSKSIHAESMSGTANQTEEKNRVQTTVTSKRSHAVTTAKRRDEISQMTGKSKHHANNTDELSTVSVRQASSNIHKTTLDGLIIVEGDATTTTNKNNHLSLLEATTPPTFAVHTMHKTEQAINEDFVHVMNDSVLPVLDTNDQTGTAAFVESNSLPEMPKMQDNDVTNDAIFDLARHAAKTAEKQNNPSAPPGTVSDSPLPASHINFKNDLTAFNKSTQQTADWIMNVTSQFQTTTTKTSEFPAATASMGGHIMSTEDHESLLSTSESVHVVSEKSSQAAHAEHTVQSNSHIEALSLREPFITPTTGKLTPAVRRKITTETQSVKQAEHEILTIEQSQHAPPAMMTITHPINDPEQNRHAGLVKIVHRAEWAQAPTSTVDRKHISPGKTSISQVIFGAMTDSIPRMAISPTELIKKNNCRTTDCAKPGKKTTTTGAKEIDHNEKRYKTQAGSTTRDHFSAEHTAGTTLEYDKCGSGCFVPGKAASPALLSAVTNKSDNDNASVDETMSTQATSMTDKAAHLEKHTAPEQARFIKKSTQRRFHRQNSESQEVIAAEVTSSEPEETTAQTTMKTSERILLSGKNGKTQLNRKASQAEILEAQNATRSVRAVSKGEMAGPESGRSLLLLEPESESELPRLEHRRTSAHLYLSGVTEVSDDLCGSGNYTAEMSLGTGVEPGDVVPSLGNLRVVINLRTNNSQINLGVTSCCLSPTIQPDLTNSTCCLFSRLAAEPAGITLLPSALSTSASFTISLFQMINYSVVYLHCDLSVCLRNHSDCERQCLQQRSAFSSEGPETIVTNLRNRISFGPMLKQVKNSTFPEAIDSSQLDLVLVIVSLVVGSCLVTVMLLLVWLAYRRRAIWLLQSAAPPRACCGCLHPGGDLILP